MKKSKLTYSILMIVAVIGVLIFSAPIFSLDKPVAISYAQSFQLQSLENTSLTTYKLNYGKKLIKEEANSLANKLTVSTRKSLNFEVLSYKANEIVTLQDANDKSANMEMDLTSGNFIYNGGMNEYLANGDTKNLVKSEQAATKAMKHLDDLGLKFNKKEMVVAHIGGVNTATNINNTSQIYKKLVTVRYNRVLNGIPVIGASRIVVKMGTDGNLAGLIYNWPDVISTTAVKSTELYNSTEINNQLDNKLKLIGKAGKNNTKINVQKSNLVLYDDGKGNVEPAYFVEANMNYNTINLTNGKNDTNNVPVDFLIPVLKNSQAEFPAIGLPNTPVAR